MPLVPAKQAEIIRSNQKDVYYTSYIRGAISDIVQSTLGASTWVRWRKELDLLADLGYFGLTTFAGFQTLGEEYVSILQVDRTKAAIPSAMTRATHILLLVLSPYLLDKLLSYVERQLCQNTMLDIRPEAKQRLLATVPVVRHVITIVHRCHLALFYMRGLFYHIAKRLVHIRYVLVRPGVKEESRSNYRLLGWLSATQLSVVFLQQLYKFTSRRWREKTITLSQGETEGCATTPKTVDDSPLISSPASKCPLCLESRNHSTATPCGHLFCWACIFEWGSTKPQCPICREKFQLSRLIFLQNYYMS